MILRKMMTKMCCGNFEKSSLECEKMASRKVFRHLLRANLFMFILLISNHTVFLIQSGSCNFNFLENSLVQINSNYLYLQNTRQAMNELPVIGYPCLREELWDRQGANIASPQKEMYGEKLFRGTRKRFLREINAFSLSFLSRMDLGNVYMSNM